MKMIMMVLTAILSVTAHAEKLNFSVVKFVSENSIKLNGKNVSASVMLGDNERYIVAVGEDNMWGYISGTVLEIKDGFVVNTKSTEHSEGGENVIAIASKAYPKKSVILKHSQYALDPASYTLKVKVGKSNLEFPLKPDVHLEITK